jgi:hypothetical protein
MDSGSGISRWAYQGGTELLDLTGYMPLEMPACRAVRTKGAMPESRATQDQYVFKHKDSLEKALASVEQVKAKLPNLTARDCHELVRCYEARSMATCAETLFNGFFDENGNPGFALERRLP